MEVFGSSAGTLPANSVLMGKLPVFLKTQVLLWVMLAQGQLGWAQLESSYEEFRRGELTLTQEFRANLGEFQFIFVGGFGNELAYGYFKDNVETLRAMGVADVHVVFPSSTNSATDNIPLLKEKIVQLYAEGNGKPIILIGHSKGGLESVGLALANPELIRRRIIARVIAVQAPLAGCHLGDLSDRLILIGKAMGEKLRFLDGLRSLRTSEIRDLIEDRVAQMRPADRNLVSSALLYVVSRQEIRKTSRLWSAGSLFMRFVHRAENDGLVATHDMWIRGVGRVMGELVADHTELLIKASRFTRTIGLTSSGELQPRSFTSALAIETLADIESQESGSRLSQGISEQRQIDKEAADLRRQRPRWSLPWTQPAARSQTSISCRKSLRSRQ